MSVNVGIDVSKESLDICLLHNQTKSGRKHRLWVPDSLNTRNIKSLSRRLSALEKDRLREPNRLEASEISDANDRVKSSIMRVIKVIDEEISSIEQEMELTIRADSESDLKLGLPISCERWYLHTNSSLSLFG